MAVLATGGGDPNFMKRPGGEMNIGGQAANYITTALPFDFTIHVNADSDPIATSRKRCMK